MFAVISKLTRSAIATAMSIGIGITVAAGAARADDIYALQAREMNKGQDYIAAWAAASRAVATVASPAQIADAQRHDAALARGVDYAAAWGPSPGTPSAEQIAEANAVASAVREGRDYADAWTAARNAAPEAAAPSAVVAGRPAPHAMK